MTLKSGISWIENQDDKNVIECETVEGLLQSLKQDEKH
jgi:hypothetical protein